ncbi:MAG: F-box protein [Kistimonas sp.]|nr:F-box protein [Kistimonas sp.]
MSLPVTTPVTPPVTPASCSPEPTPAQMAAAPGHDAAVQACRRKDPLLTASPTDMSPPSARAKTARMGPPGQDLSRWPVHLLRQVLQHLSPVNLARAARVCRRWYEAARDLSLQEQVFRRELRRFIQAYPSDHLQRLQWTLDAEPTRGHMARWQAHQPRQCARWRELELLRSFPLSSQALFYVLTQQMLHARRITYYEEDGSWGSSIRCDCSLAHYHLPYSPDGAFFVLPHDLASPLSPPKLQIWEHGHRFPSLSTCEQLACDPVHNGISFNAYNNELLVVTRLGGMERWTKRHADSLARRASWEPSAEVRLCDTLVTAAQFSPDARWMALQTDASVLVFRSAYVAGTEQWLACARQRWTRREPADDQELPEPDVMQFSNNSCHFLFVNDGRAFAFDCHDDSWQELEDTSQHRRYPVASAVLAGRGDAIALASHTGSRTPATDARHSIELWGHSQQRGWCLSSRTVCTGTASRLPLALRPDSQQLVFPDRLDTGEQGICVMSRPPNENWQLTTRLSCGPAMQGPACPGGIGRLSFSVHGRYLAAVSHAGVQLWQHDEAASWLPAAWIENDNKTESPLFLFAPDGFHCVMSVGRPGRVFVYGPTPDGSYAAKMQLLCEHPVNQLGLAPDGLRLLVSCTEPHPDTDCISCLVRVLRLEPRYRSETLTAATTQAS